MTAPITMTQPGSSIQRDRRGWTDEFTDQHGRKFSAWYELANGRPIGELSPVGFNPPWLPPMDAIQWERPGGFRFRWDYERIARDFAQGSEAFYTEVMEFMIEHMPTTEPPDVDEPIPAKARRLFKPPMSAAIPIAADAGEPWILGTPGAEENKQLKELLAQTVNANGRQAVEMIRQRTRERFAANGTQAVPTIPAEPVASIKAKTINTVDLRQISDVTYNEFAAEAMRGGMTRADAADAWHKHKANLAAEAA